MTSSAPPPATPRNDKSDGRFYPLVDCRCTHRDHGDNPNVYRCVGSCSNCRSGPYLMLVTSGHRKPTGRRCPKCGCYDLAADRLAEDDELPDPVAGRDLAGGDTHA